MSNGIYSAYTGALANLAQIEGIANNLANADTAGFRRDQMRFDTVLGGRVDFARVPESRIDLSPGTTKLDGDPLHAAIDGPGFFVFEAEDGSEQYTRRGDFRLNSAGQLVLPNGALVLGAAGPLAVPPGARAELRGDGSLATEAGIVGQLRIVEFESAEGLMKRGESGIAAAGAEPTEVANPSIAPGFVESANVNVSEELVNLILAQRSFEAGMTSLRIHDEMSESVVDAAQS